MAKTFIGLVRSDKGDKTIVVAVTTSKRHPLYKKQYHVTKRFMAHDADNQAKMGDKVQISETRPISASKHFKLDQIIEKAQVKHVEATPEIVAKPAKIEVKPVKTTKKKPAPKEEKTK